VDHRSSGGLGALSVVGASVLWGTTGTVATFAADVSPLAIGAAAMGVGGLLQALAGVRPMALARRQLRSHLAVIILGAVAVALYPLAFYTSMRLAGVAVGTVVSIGSAPLASALIERMLDKHKLGPRWAAGAVFGLAGAVLLCLSQSASPEPAGGGSAGSSAAGIILGLVAGLTYAVYSWAAHRLMAAGVPSSAAMGSIFGLGGLLLMPVLLATGAPFLASWSNAGVGAYMALVPMFAGYVLFGWGLRRVRASTATTLSLIEPVVAAALAVLVIGERLPALGWLGVALVIGSLVVLTFPAGLLPFRKGPVPEVRGGPGAGDPSETLSAAGTGNH
jgi:DME family drug/metabolite transporter